jgi:hypothetical protein
LLPGEGFTSVYFEGSNDQIGRAFNPNRVHGIQGRLSALRVSRNRVLLVARVPRTVKSWVEIEPGFNSDELAENRGGHFVPFFTLKSESNTLLPALFERVIRNAIARKLGKRFNMGQLFAPIPGSDETRAETSAIEKWRRDDPMLCR